MEVNRDKFWWGRSKIFNSFIGVVITFASFASAQPGHLQADAEKLVLQKRRMAAIQLILDNSKSKKDLQDNQKLLDRLSQIFISEKAQNIYEEVLSQKYADVNSAYDRITEALGIEPDNLLLVLEKSRLALRKGDCDKVAETLLPYTKISFPSEDIQTLLFGVQVCRDPKATTGAATGLMIPPRPAKNSAWWLLVELEHYANLKDEAKMRETLLILQGMNFNSPQVYYWKWRIDKFSKKTDSEAGKKYVQRCKNLSSSEFREYFRDPHLCQYVGEIDETAN